MRIAHIWHRDEVSIVEKGQIAAVFYQIADMLEINGASRYRFAAYRRAGEAIENSGEDLGELWHEGRLREIPGVGSAIAAKIDELLSTGRLEFHERLKREIPPGVVSLLSIPGVGPRTAKMLYESLGVQSIAEAERAALRGELRELPGLGERSERNILEGIRKFRLRGERVPLGTARPIAQGLLRVLKDNCPQMLRADIVGSIRRWQATVGNIDLLVASEEPVFILDCLAGLPGVEEVLSRGATWATALSTAGIRVDLRVVDPARYGSHLAHFTGSVGHSQALESLALRKGLSWSEAGLWGGGKEIICGREEQFYQAMGLPWITPELREARGELVAGERGELPELVELADIRGDLHCHTDWSDGVNSLEEMVEAARELGYEYLVISDHTKGLGVAGGLDEERLRRQREEVVRVNERYTDIEVLWGAEVEIRGDGSLDFPDEFLAEPDVVVASLHSGLRQDRERITARALAALRNPHVDILGHPLGRIVGQREPSELDMERVIAVAAETGTALEVNSIPSRLDLDDVHIHRAIGEGVKLAINSDAHRVGDLEAMPWGVAMARRGWAETADVVNALSLPELKAWLARPKP